MAPPVPSSMPPAQPPYPRNKTLPRRGMPGVGPAIQLMQEPFERTIDSAARQVLRARDLVLQHGNQRPCLIVRIRHLGSITPHRMRRAGLVIALRF